MDLEDQLAGIMTDVSAEERLSIDSLSTIDYFIHKYEVERRKGENFDEQIKNLRTKIHKKKQQLTERYQHDHELKISKRTDELQNNITCTQAKLGLLKKDTEEIRKKIQIMRRANMRTEKKQHETTYEISRSQSATRGLVGNSTTNFGLIRNSRSVMTKLNRSYKIDQSLSQMRESMLHTELQAVSKTVFQAKLRRPRTPHAEFSTYLKVLKFLDKKYKKISDVKQLEIIDYESHIRNISRAIYAIGTSIASHDVTEIAKIHSSSYEQELQLRCHALEINENIEKIERKLETIDAKMKALIESADQKKAFRTSVLFNKSLELDSLKQKNTSTKLKQQKFDIDLKYSNGIMTQLVQKLHNLGLEPLTHKITEEYDINYSNQDIYLSSLEEMIHLLSYSYLKMHEQKKEISGIILSPTISPKHKIDAQLKILEAEIFKQEFEDLIMPLSLVDLRHNARMHVNKQLNVKYS